jgi:hypothetical protein
MFSDFQTFARLSTQQQTIGQDRLVRFSIYFLKCAFLVSTTLIYSFSAVLAFSTFIMPRFDRNHDFFLFGSYVIFNRYPAICRILGTKSGHIITDAKRHVNQEEKY